MYAQYKTLRTIFQPVRECSKNRQLFEFEISGAAQNPTEITSNAIGSYAGMMNPRSEGNHEIFELQEVDDFLDASKLVAS